VGGREAVCVVRDAPPYRELVAHGGRPYHVASRRSAAALARRILRRPPVDVQGIVSMLDDWAARIGGGHPALLPSFADGYCTVAVVEAGLASLEAGGVDVPVRSLPA
jgi:hypothetical protein